MAKKITNTEAPAPETKSEPMATQETVEQGVNAFEEPAPDEEPEKPQSPEPEEGGPGKPEKDMPGYTEKILKIFSNYPQLYIDYYGGTFTVDTPPIFRSSATLYQNPYHKP